METNMPEDITQEVCEETAELENLAGQYHNLELEAKNIDAQKQSVRTKINQFLVEQSITDFTSANGVSIKRFTPNGRRMLNRTLVEDFCTARNVDAEQFFKTSEAKEQIKILIPETKEKMKAFLNAKD
jgi:hypothetical protein